MRKPLLIGTFILACVWVVTNTKSEAVANASGELSYPGYEIHKLEQFSVEARILSRKNYNSGREAALSPLDLAIGWGPMAKESVLKMLTVKQRNRWFFWSAEKLPISRQQITLNSSNVHIIPGNTAVAKALSKLESNDTVRLSGQLVDVHTQDGWQWLTSRTRKDSGAGACEVLWLEQLEWI